MKTCVRERHGESVFEREGCINLSVSLSVHNPNHQRYLVASEGTLLAGP